ncbi:MAG: glycosyltransferase family 39 protein [Microgenomates group bacterium]
MKTKLILLGIIVLTVLLHVVKVKSLPVCLNADEAAFGYNAYSLLKTGKDEYGAMLPLRLKSFGDYKLPLYSYLSVPFIGAMGLTETSTRALAMLIGILFPLVVYFLTKELFEDERISLLAAFLTGVSPWIQITARHAHEAPLAVFLLTIAATLLLRFIKTSEKKYLYWFAFVELLSLFAYHLSRPIVLGMIVYLGVALFLRVKKQPPGDRKSVITRAGVLMAIAALPLLAFTFTDVLYNPTRLKNLIFFNDGGFKLSIKQKLTEKNLPIIYNPVTQSLLDLPKEYIKYFSPEFLVVHGDTNYRFGYPGISLISLVEYGMVFVGLYFLINKRPKNMSYILFLLLIGPVAASLSFFEYSATRSIFMVVPLLIIASYGAISLVDSLTRRYRVWAAILLFTAFGFFNFMTWDFYFFHYPYRAVTVRSWQCGYKELAQYVNTNYDKFEKFNITTRNGEPYIFMLFYSKYPPELYQKQATLSPPDEYGFGQVWEFDKYDFQFNVDHSKEGTSYIGYPEHFKDKADIDTSKIQKITAGTEEMFYIYEP